MALEFQFHSFANASNALVAGKLLTVAIWAETLQTSKALQTSMVVASVLGGAALYYKTKNVWFLYGAVDMFLNIPYTLLALGPINKKLLDIRHHNTVNGKSNTMKDNITDDNTVEALLSKWSLLHSGRTLLSYAALFATVYGVISESAIRFIVYK
ncbi:hypothetical protein BGW38_009662 [Lunasporangiospora selenospora]|uniref:Uncharacterized protein n=1 Tax=Lunasporangiospora selenospora TaxID=979761 RepID=A0A9P6FXJ0_9FUNG|nr:hypothetical protein BGW38_009662 [Lunasporangiospora selenospora]